MSQIRSKNTKPEVMFRKYIWEQGLKGYRVHSKLPGKPDLYFGSANVAIFIDGCFWHKCPKCYRSPKTNKKFWNKKFRQNVERDLNTDISLEQNGIRVLRFWEHDIKNDIIKCYKKLKNKLLC